MLAKWLAARCRILILDEPTRGVDVGAKAEIHALIDELASRGAGVLLISSELPEVLNLCTRIIVLRQGSIAGELPRAAATQDGLMRLMAGVARSQLPVSSLPASSSGGCRIPDPRSPDSDVSSLLEQPRVRYRTLCSPPERRNRSPVEARSPSSRLRRILPR